MQGFKASLKYLDTYQISYHKIECKFGVSFDRRTTCRLFHNAESKMIAKRNKKCLVTNFVSFMLKRCIFNKKNYSITLYK